MTARDNRILKKRFAKQTKENDDFGKMKILNNLL